MNTCPAPVLQHGMVFHHVSTKLFLLTLPHHLSSSIILRVLGAAHNTTRSCRETGSPPPASSGQRSSMAAALGLHLCTLLRCPGSLQQLPLPRRRISGR
uniref:Uncharacterized protein n=1 Tax=Arundo donax TaxID=35708 RepID=A0A0A9D1T8_ARUDO